MSVAEAACSHVVEMAKAALADASNEVPQALRELASIRDRDAEESCHKLFRKYNLTVKVPIETICVGEGEAAALPIVKISSWVRYILDNDLMEQLCGVPLNEVEPLLGEFWTRFRDANPQHGIFAAEADTRLNRTVPVFAHIDDGRTYKSKGLTILSIHGCLGKGTRNYVRRVGVRKVHLKRSGMPMNFLGSTWANQFLFASLLRSVQHDHPEALNLVLSSFASDMAELASSGVTCSNGERLWLQLVGLKGDLPALQKAGSFVRHFGRCPRQASSVVPCVGVCFLCLAGREHPPDQAVPFEQFCAGASWERTQGMERPWDRENPPAILHGILNYPVPERFFLPDFFHNWHGGLAKIFIANALIMIAYSDIVTQRSLVEKLQWISNDFRAFCRRSRITPHMKEFTRENLSFDAFSACPMGLWSKASISTHSMLYLQDLFDRFAGSFDSDPFLPLIVSRSFRAAHFSSSEGRLIVLYVCVSRMVRFQSRVFRHKAFSCC